MEMTSQRTITCLILENFLKKLFFFFFSKSKQGSVDSTLEMSVSLCCTGLRAEREDPV